MKPLVVVAVLLALATPAIARDPIAPIPLGDIGYGGSGCPGGSADIITNPDRRSALLSLSGYAVGDNGRSIDRKTCALAIPVDVPSGVAVAIRGVAVIGSVDLPAGVEATLSLEAFVAGDQGETTELTLTGVRDGNWFRVISIPWDNLVWTGCGEDSNLRVNTSLRTKGNESAKISIDNLALFRFATKAC